MIDKTQLKLHFSKNASNYDRYSNIQKKMKNTLLNSLMETIKDTSKIKNILEIGCGTGSLTKSLIEIFPSANITALDIAPGMIDEIKLNFKNNNITFICEDIETFNLNYKYDLIISNATFQWFNEPSNTLKKLYSSLNASGSIYFSTFGEKTFYELHECFQKTRKNLSIPLPISPGQSFFNLQELISLCKSTLFSFCNNNLLVEGYQTFECEYFKTCKEFLYCIKKIGANNSNKNNRCTSPIFIKNVMNLYDENFKENNQVRCTYHCLFFKIVK